MTYKFETRSIVFNGKFDETIDIFRIPFYSLLTYVTKRIKEKLVLNKITDISFVETKDELGQAWKPHYPTIQFEN